MDLILGIVVGGVVCGGVVALFFVFQKKGSGPSHTELEARFTQVAQDVLRGSQEQLVSLAKERLGADRELAKEELEHKQNTIARMIEEVRKDLIQNKEYLRQTDSKHLASFSALKQELETYRSITEQLRGSTNDLKKLLSNNQLRGQFGEQVAENLLKMAGFVVGQDYVFNTTQETKETRPDFTIFLPDKTKIHVDAKFPYSALMHATSTESKEEKQRYHKQFATDVRQKIKQVTTRDYINPKEKTVDFVILFIPNEMIFSFIYDQCNDVWEEAMRKKVIMAGPFSFTAILRMVKQAYSNFRYQENLHHVIGLIQTFEKEYVKYGDAVDKLGDRLSSAVRQYEAVSGTRTRKLNKIVDQITNEQISAPEEGVVAALSGDLDD